MVRAYDQGSLVAFSASRWLEVALCVPGTRLQADHHAHTWERNTEVQEPDQRRRGDSDHCLSQRGPGFDFSRLLLNKSALFILLRCYRKALGHPIHFIDWDPFECPLPSLRGVSGERISCAHSDHAAGAAPNRAALP